MQRHLPARHPAQRAAAARTRPTACCACGRPSAGSETQTVDAEQRRSPASRARATGCRSAATRCRSSTPAWSARSARRCTCAAARCTTSPTSAPTCCSRCWCATPRRSGSTRRSACPERRWPALKGPRLDIINAINLGRPIPVADGFTGDVITLDAAIDSSFPNGRRVGGGTAPNRNQVNVNSVLHQPDRRRQSRRRAWRRASRSTTRTTSIASRSWRRRTRGCSRAMAASTCRRCRTFRRPAAGSRETLSTPPSATVSCHGRLGGFAACGLNDDTTTTTTTTL